jgi:hypothetical protein
MLTLWDIVAQVRMLSNTIIQDKVLEYMITAITDFSQSNKIIPLKDTPRGSA